MDIVLETHALLVFDLIYPEESPFAAVNERLLIARRYSEDGLGNFFPSAFVNRAHLFASEMYITNNELAAVFELAGWDSWKSHREKKIRLKFFFFYRGKDQFRMKSLCLLL